MSNYTCKCGCDEFIENSYSILEVNSNGSGFNVISNQSTEEEVTCRECGCSAEIKDGKFISYCDCGTEGDTDKW